MCTRPPGTVRSLAGHGVGRWGRLLPLSTCLFPSKASYNSVAGVLGHGRQRGTWRLKDPTALTQSPCSSSCTTKNRTSRPPATHLPPKFPTCPTGRSSSRSRLASFQASSVQAVFSSSCSFPPGIPSVGTESSPPGLEATTKGMQFGCPRNTRIPCKGWWQSSCPGSA